MWQMAESRVPLATFKVIQVEFMYENGLQDQVGVTKNYAKAVQLYQHVQRTAVS